MRSYVVKRLPHFRHSRRRRIESASLLSRESTTLSSKNPQKGHFMALAWGLNPCVLAKFYCIRANQRSPGTGSCEVISDRRGFLSRERTAAAAAAFRSEEHTS